MEGQTKIMILASPYSGHINPILGFAQELVQNPSFKVIFYATDEYKNEIVATGAEYRSYTNYDTQSSKPTPKKGGKTFAVDIFRVMLKFLKMNEKIVVDLSMDIDREKPDLIIYDVFTSFTKWVFKILDENVNNSKNSKNSLYRNFQPSIKAPLAISFTTSVAMKFGIYPSRQQMKLLNKTGIFEQLWSLIVYSMSVYRFCWKFGLKFVNPFKTLPFSDAEVNLVFTFPEFQPQFQLFDKSYRFVGCCIADKIRAIQLSNNQKIEEILQKFPIINSPKKNQVPTASGNKLIFVSLGTVFNDIVFAFTQIVNGIIQLNKSHLTFIVSTGAKVLKHFNSQIEDEKLFLPENIILVETAPQIELLKRASLFVTHCGMNSTMETIFYGVPVVCIPQAGDQPLLAERLTKDLGMGVQIDTKTLTSEKVKVAIGEVLANSTYSEKAKNYSEKSRVYDGRITAVDEVIAFLKIKSSLKNY